MYFLLVECLAREESHELPLAVIPGIAFKFGATAEKVRDAIAYFVSLELFEQSETRFWSNSLKKRMEQIDQKRSVTKDRVTRYRSVTPESVTPSPSVTSKSVTPDKVSVSMGSAAKEEKEATTAKAAMNLEASFMINPRSLVFASAGPLDQRNEVFFT
jgi:pyruvate/2-oxoacid:ferredoxin oxidoreductase alpha subunit